MLEPLVMEIFAGPREQPANTATIVTKMTLYNRIILMWLNGQLTDGGPPAAFELPGRIPGPPFGGAGVRLTWA
jgi:hypothetical protein